MKKYFQHTITLIIHLHLLLYGCQEEVDINPISKDQVIRYNSELADLVKRIAMKDGSDDNILDHASCLTVKLPVKVNDNGHVVEIKSIHSIDDLLILKNILDKSDAEDGKLSLIFPLTVTLPDYTEKTVRNEDDFKILVNQCIEGGDDENIECIDFIYDGLRISYYDQIKQSSHGITLWDDKSLFTFFNELNENDLVSFNFPVVMVLNGDQRMQINNNQDMIDIIQDAAGNCEEHDDTIFYVDDSGFKDFLIEEGTWIATSIFDDGENTAIFDDYTFLFERDGTIAVTSGGLVLVTGSWMTQGKYGVIELNLDFGDSYPLEKISKVWNIAYWGRNSAWNWPVFDLQNKSTDDGLIKKITFYGWY